MRKTTRLSVLTLLFAVILFVPDFAIAVDPELSEDSECCSQNGVDFKISCIEVSTNHQKVVILFKVEYQSNHATLAKVEWSVTTIDGISLTEGKWDKNFDRELTIKLGGGTRISVKGICGVRVNIRITDLEYSSDEPICYVDVDEVVSAVCNEDEGSLL